MEQKIGDKAGVAADVEPNAAPRSMKMKLTRSTDHSMRKQTDVHGKHSTREIAASAATDFNGSWTCLRCTLLNGIRRKNCEVCGSPRGLSMDEDGKLSIDESSDVGADFTVDMIKEDGAEGDASISSSHAQSCQATGIGSNERQRQSQMSDIFDAPVGTRSRRRQTQSTERIQNPAKQEPFRADYDANRQQGHIEDSTPPPCGDTVNVRVRLALSDARKSSHDDGGLFTSLPTTVLSKIAFRDMSGTSASSPSVIPRVFVSVNGSRVSDEPLLSSRECRDDKSIFKAKVPETTVDEADTLGSNVPFSGGDADEQNVAKLVENLRELVDVSGGDFDEERADVLTIKKPSKSDKKPVGENDLSSMIQECSTEASHSISSDLHKERLSSSGAAVGSGALESSEGMTFEKKDNTALQGTIKSVGDLQPDIGTTTSVAVDEHGVCGDRQSFICEEENLVPAEAAGQHIIAHRSQTKTATIPFIPMTQQAPDFDYMTQVGMTLAPCFGALL